jgi:hypothetical protein
MIHIGDCLEVMRTLGANSVDAIVTDPPYGLGFMGKAWDHGVPGEPFWREALRVAKPGAFLAAFGGTRTFHRLACAIEDAGWELRDCVPYAHDGVHLEPMADCPWLLAWVYGSGFPKSHNGEWGGTALKPAWEPIVLARKPLIGTVEANWREHGTGALNIDGCRIESEGGAHRDGEASQDRRYTERGGTNFAPTPGPRGGDPSGRWPANVIHDGSDEVVALFPNTTSGTGSVKRESGAEAKGNSGPAYGRESRPAGTLMIEYGDAGSAARFFYCAKADRNDRNDGCDGLPVKQSGMVSNTSGQHMTRRDGGASEPAANHHPTVKPTDLMRWLCRLVTPPGGVILDPFTGSGSTGRGAIAEGFRFVGIELDPEYAAIAEARIRAVQPGLPFGAAA